MTDSSDFKNEDIFHLEDSMFDVIQRPTTAIIPEQNMDKEIFLFPKKGINKKKNLISGRKFKKEVLQIFEKSDDLITQINVEDTILDAEKYPGEIVESEKGFFISLQDKKGKFSWFLMK